MKKLFMAMLVSLTASMSVTIYAGTPIKQSELPETSQAFISQYFSKDEIKKVEKDNGRRGLEYEVDFNSGAEIEFNSDGGWKEVKAAKGFAVPDEIVPDAISQYVKTNFKDESIVEISRKRGGYSIKLSNGKELSMTEDAKPMQPRQGNRGGKGGKGQRRN